MTWTQFVFTLGSCAFFMAIVAVISYWKTKGEVNDSTGYFLAGRGLTGGFIAGSLLLTNLSAEHLIGLNGQAYRGNMSNMAWEVTAGLAIVIMALLLLPKYLGGAFSTLPEFLRSRYDEGVRRYVVILFMLGYVLVTIPSTLYSGALAVLKLFNVPELLGITHAQSVWLVIWLIGIIGAIYAIFGGLKAVAISDTLNGIGLLIVGVLVPILGFLVLGDGNLLAGMKQITVEHAGKLNAIGSSQDSVPFGTIFTGMIFANLFYWGTNQYVIQRTLGAKSLAEGQKGVIFTAFFKLSVPFMMMIPGIIAFHLYGPGKDPVDLAYPTLVADVLPTYLSGFFLAVLLGAVFSTFNSLLNSAATMFALDVYKPKINPDADDGQLIRVSKYFGTVIALVSFVISPLLMNAPEGLWELIRRFTGFFNIPIIVLVLVGIFTKRVPAFAAKVVILSHVVVYYFLVWGFPQLFNIEIPINFIHIQGILFVAEVAMMLLIGKWRPLEKPYKYRRNTQIEMVPWKYATLSTVILLACLVEVFLIFSPIGLAYTEGVISPFFWPVSGMVVLLALLSGYMAINRWNERYTRYLDKQYSGVNKKQVG